MKTYIAFVLIGLSSVAMAGDCIIDPQNVMVHGSSEPLFLNSEEKARDIASNKAETPVHYTRSPDQYLEVLKVIPVSDPKLQRTWLEYKIMKED